MKKYAIAIAMILLVGTLSFSALGKKKTAKQRKAKNENIEGQKSFYVNGVKFTMITV